MDIMMCSHIGTSTGLSAKPRRRLQKTPIPPARLYALYVGVNPMTMSGRVSHQPKPEVYARENFNQARAHVDHGAPFENTNLPPGHKFQDWTIAGEMAKEKAGVYVQDLKTNGDWGNV